MTAPTPEPTPPVAPPAPVPPAPPVDPATPSAPPAAPPAADAPPAPEPWSDPTAAKAEIERLRKENAKDRTSAKEAAAAEARKALAAELGKILDPEANGPVDPATLTANLTTAQDDAKQARVALAVWQNAGAALGDPVALLDSTTFLASVATLDPADPAAVQAAIKTAVAANPRLGAAPTDPRAPAPIPGQGGSGGGTPDASALIAAARAKGDWQTVIALENQKLTQLKR